MQKKYFIYLYEYHHIYYIDNSYLNSYSFVLYLLKILYLKSVYRQMIVVLISSISDVNSAHEPIFPQNTMQCHSLEHYFDEEKHKCSREFSDRTKNSISLNHTHTSISWYYVLQLHSVRIQLCLQSDIHSILNILDRYHIVLHQSICSSTNKLNN